MLSKAVAYVIEPRISTEPPRLGISMPLIDMCEIAKPSIDRAVVIMNTNLQPRNCVITPPRKGAKVNPR